MGSLALSLIVILVLVGLGGKWISSTSCLVMASTVIFVNHMKMEACQGKNGGGKQVPPPWPDLIFTLGEASSSTMAWPFSFSREEWWVKVAKNATHAQRSQEFLSILGP